MLPIEQIKQYLATQPIIRAYLFGSYARDEAHSDSDVDILVELDPQVPVGLEFVQMYLDLKELIGKEVDLLTPDSVSPFVLPRINQEKVLLYERKAG